MEVRFPLEEFLLKLLGSLVMSVVLFYGIQLFDVYIAYWLSLVISLVIVFGGLLILDNSDFHVLD